MIGAQFAISAFMLAVVTIVFMQNEKVKESSYLFPRSEIYTLERLNVESIRDRLETLRHELEALPNVDRVAFSSQVPFGLGRCPGIHVDHRLLFGQKGAALARNLRYVARL